MLLHCVRHGETIYNAEGRIQGQSDAPLSELGRRQSEALAAWFASEPIDAVYSSPLSRSLDTATPIAAALGLEVMTDVRLMELNAGIFQGLLRSELETRCPAEFASWSSHDPDFVIPEGESRRQLMLRGMEALEDIGRRAHRQAVVVAHGGLLTAALKGLLGIPAERHPFMLYNASISIIDWSGPLRLLTLNGLEHLRTAQYELESRTGDL